MADRPRRPTRHFTPRSGWVNDPLALTWRDGRYHLFFQHVPAGTTWAPHCHWGHATSTDLLTWEERPVALRPADDETGCWSGCIVRDDRTDGAGDLLLYTSVHDEDLDLGEVRVARPDGTGDPWDHWTPGEVLVRPPQGAGVRYFRDPVVLRDGDEWRMLVGGGVAGPDAPDGPGTAAVFGYASEDLVTWRGTGLVAARSGAETEPEWTGTVWECPQLLRVGDVDVLVVSVWDAGTLHHLAAAPGRWADGRFTASGRWQRLSHGVPYAATAFTSNDGRPALLSWLREVADEDGGWAGSLGLPLAVDVVGDRVVLDLLVDPGSVTWEPDGQRLTVEDAGESVAAVTADADGVVVTPADGGPSLRLPRGAGPVRVVVDGPVLEVLHAGRYGALVLTR
jgi:beta-fructofuranosidase